MRGLILVFAFISCVAKVKTKEIPAITCNSGSHRCADNSRCVLDKELCDFNKHCDDYSDERFSMCRKIQERRGMCQKPGQVYNSDYGQCYDISTICDQTKVYFEEPHSIMCYLLDGGLEPFDEMVTLSKEVSTLREEVKELQGKTKLEDVFGHLATSFNESYLAINDSVCPPLYVNIKDKCVAMFVIVEVTWAEAKQFCESISGTLAILHEVEDYIAILQHLKNQDLTTNFWIGGYYSSNTNQESSWSWLDNETVPMGAPYWSLYRTSNNCSTKEILHRETCCQLALSPKENRNGFCLSLDYADHYYFKDQNCLEKRSPLCFLNEKEQF